MIVFCFKQSGKGIMSSSAVNCHKSSIEGGMCINTVFNYSFLYTFILYCLPFHLPLGLYTHVSTAKGAI